MGYVWRTAFYGLVILIFGYLLFPILIVIPLSFSSGKYLTFPPPGFSLQWYRQFLHTLCLDGIRLAQHLGRPCRHSALDTPGNASRHWPRSRQVRGEEACECSYPVAGDCAGHHCRNRPLLRLCELRPVGRPLALVLGHTALAVPFVVINVSSTLYGVDRRLEYAALSLGASPWATFRQITLPLIRPGNFAGAVFAFITSFDELLVALFSPARRQSPCRGGCGSRSASISIRRLLRFRPC